MTQRGRIAWSMTRGSIIKNAYGCICYVRENDVFYRLCCLHMEAHKVPPSCFTSITRRGRLACELWPILNVSEPQRTVANICIEPHLIHGPECNSSSVQQRPLLVRSEQIQALLDAYDIISITLSPRKRKQVLRFPHKQFCALFICCCFFMCGFCVCSCRVLFYWSVRFEKRKINLFCWKPTA